jgi:hypothetical protein
MFKKFWNWLRKVGDNVSYEPEQGRPYAEQPTTWEKGETTVNQPSNFLGENPLVFLGNLGLISYVGSIFNAAMKDNFWADTVDAVTGFFTNKANAQAQTQTATANAAAISNAVKGLAIIAGVFLVLSMVFKKIFK